MKMQRFNHITACILLSVFVLQIFSKGWVYISFLANKDYIAKNICENRAKPKLHCNGKCYLYKELKKADTREHSATNMVNEMGNFEFCTHVSSPFFGPDLCIEKSLLFRYYVAYPQPHQYSIFHPPTV